MKAVNWIPMKDITQICTVPVKGLVLSSQCFCLFLLFSVLYTPPGYARAMTWPPRSFDRNPVEMIGRVKAKQSTSPQALWKILKEKLLPGSFSWSRFREQHWQGWVQSAKLPSKLKGRLLKNYSILVSLPLYCVPSKFGCLSKKSRTTTEWECVSKHLYCICFYIFSFLAQSNSQQKRKKSHLKDQQFFTVLCFVCNILSA